MAEKKAVAPGTVRVSLKEATEPLTPENSIPLSGVEFFDMLKKDVLDEKLGFGGVMDGVMRNTLRPTIQNWTRIFAHIPLLRNKNSLWLQLILPDEDRAIQGKLYALGGEIACAKSHTYVAERSRKLFREAVPSLLLDGGADRWIFSRSLFLPRCEGLVEDAISFPLYDPFDCLVDILKDVPSEMSLEVPQDDPSGVRCAEAFLFLAGDFPTRDGYSSRETILELLHELNSPNGNHKLHGFWCCAGSEKLTKEKADELKGVHVPVKSKYNAVSYVASSEKDRGNEYFKEKKFKEAIDCYSRSIGHSPSPQAYANRAMAYLKMCNYLQAENDCTEALKLDGQYMKVYARRAIARKELGKVKEAIEDAELCLKLDPDQNDILELLLQLNSLLKKETVKGDGEDGIVPDM